MPLKFRAKYKDQLPRHSKITWERVINFFGSSASVIALYLFFSTGPDLTSDQKYIVGLSYLFFIILILLTYILFKETSKRHRYAQAVYHIHFVNHTIRDYLADLKLGKEVQLSTTLEDIVDAISFCFSIIEGRRCRCSIKEVKSGNRPIIQTAARDSLSKTSSRDTGKYTHYIDENTDFSNLWNGTNGNVRYFRGVKLKDMWDNGDYENSSFKAYNSPKRNRILIFSWVSEWNLPYNCTMVWPIRYIPDYSFWPPDGGASNTQDDASKKPHIWGYLCVDTDKSKAFGSQNAAELGALFADALYTLFTQLVFIADHTPATVHPRQNGDATQSLGLDASPPRQSRKSVGQQPRRGLQPDASNGESNDKIG